MGYTHDFACHSYMIIDLAFLQSRDGRSTSGFRRTSWRRSLTKASAVTEHHLTVTTANNCCWIDTCQGRGVPVTESWKNGSQDCSQDRFRRLSHEVTGKEEGTKVADDRHKTYYDINILIYITGYTHEVPATYICQQIVRWRILKPLWKWIKKIYI